MVLNLLLMGLLAQAPTLDIDETLRRAREDYTYGNYQASADKLSALLYPMQLRTDEQVIETRKLLGLSYYLLSNIKGAEEEFTKLLYLSPDFQLDPFSVSPPIIEKFEEIRTALKQDLDMIRLSRVAPKPESEEPPGLRIVEQRYVERTTLPLYFPFGLGQFHNGDVMLGSLFAGAHILLLAVNIGSYFWGRSMDGYSPKDKETVENLSTAQFGSLTLFALSWGFGIFQAHLHFVPRLPLPSLIEENNGSPTPSSPSALLTVHF